MTRNAVFYGAEIWTLRKTDQNYLESSKMWWRRMENFSWTDRCEERKSIKKSKGGKERPTCNKTKEI